MPELRRDPIGGRWVIVSTDNPKGPTDFHLVKPPPANAEDCPFCYGNEHLTPPEIFAKRDGGGPPNSSGWSVRVVPNKFAALKIEGGLDKEGAGMFDMMNGVGAHEVIIENPDHHKEFSQLEVGQIESVIWTYRNRSLDLRQDKRFQYILLFKNQGKAAGASLSHPHTQLIALPMIPKNVQEELSGAEHYFKYKERCIYCDMVNQETQEKKRVVAQNDAFIAFCPFASRFPFEIWLLPKGHLAAFDRIEPDMIKELAGILKNVLSRMNKVLKWPSYNFIIHTSPIEERIREEYHWHFEIMPKLSRTAGFEWGTGFYINPTPPDSAAKVLRAAKIK
jgi:UDPglucose--hexose-1-phosphate uridylyltransferase